MIDGFTYEGTNITDLLIECATITEPKNRNEALLRKMKERFSREIREQDGVELMALLSGLAYGLEYAKRRL